MIYGKEPTTQLTNNQQKALVSFLFSGTGLKTYMLLILMSNHFFNSNINFSITGKGAGLRFQKLVKGWG